MLRDKLNVRTRRSHRNRDDDLRDLGFGSRVSTETRKRLLNRDGSFNVDRTGLSFLQSLNFYHSLLTMSWWRFHGVLIGTYVILNAVFAGAFLACGEDALTGLAGQGLWTRALDAFFFSVQTFTTVGYGSVSPANLSANTVATLEAYVGLVGFAFATGLLFARFSRPSAKILYSQVAVMAPYRERKAFMFRIANQRRSQLIEVEATLIYTHLTGEGENVRREYHQLPLERNKVVFFPLHWTIVHAIDEDSPLYDVTEKDFRDSQSEFLVLLTAVDETFSQTVHSRSSYHHDEIIWDARFADPFKSHENQRIEVDLRMLHEVVRADGRA